MSMYLSYDDYREYGGTLDRTTFTDYSFEAAAQIDWYTYNRLQNEDYDKIDERVKRCMYYIISKIELIQRFQSSTGGGSSSTGVTAGIASQSNDGVSISYNILSAADTVDSARDEIKRMINIQLQGVKNSLGRRVLYRGVYPDE